MEGETQPHHHRCGWVTPLGCRKPSGTCGHPCRGEEVLQKTRAAFTSPSFFSWGGCKPRPPFPAAPGWGRAPICPMRSGAALRLGAGRAPGDPQPTQLFNAAQEPVREAAYPPGNRENPPRGAALLPRSMLAAAGLRPPNSSQQWRRIAGHTQSPACPCSTPSLSPTAADTSAEALRGAAPALALPAGDLGRRVAKTWRQPPQNDGEVWVMGVPGQKAP